MAKIFKSWRLICLLVIFLFPTIAQSQLQVAEPTRKEVRRQKRKMRAARRTANRYDIENPVNQRKRHYRRSPEDRAVDRREAKAEAAKKKKARYEANVIPRRVKKYNKKVSGGGKEVVNSKKVYRRMKKSKRKAKKFYKD